MKTPDNSEKKFNQWWDDVELANQSAGGYMPENEKNLLHEAWDTALSQPRNLRLAVALLAGVVIGVLLTRRSSKRSDEEN